jgi:hypothetical protein
MLAGDLSHLVFFSIFVIWGLSQRWNKVAHKRLMLFSTIAILGPALNRWPFASDGDRHSNIRCLQL